MSKTPVQAEFIPPPIQKTVYPPPFAALVEGRQKRKLGDYFGLSNFGVNLTQLLPGAISALLHHHSKQDEFIYVLQGNPTLVLEDQEYLLSPGVCFGVKAGSGVASQVVNRSNAVAIFLEVGDRTLGDEVVYPDDDLWARQMSAGVWEFTHKDGNAY
ncbi:MAG: cupin domain-containing protein [Gammaproteobacteria bacterium]|nr:cupin domain-containing protein [Gammaproteobacteria bacterium]